MMGSLPTEFPVSLRAWPSKHQDASSALPSLIQRINFERGGFREINQDSLRQEIAEADVAIAEGSGMSDEEEDDEKPDRMKELLTARDEMLGQIEQAHQSAMFALDFVSLLLSKDQPVQASSTISPFLRDTVPMGTLGADKLHTSRVTETQKQENNRIAKGWKIQNLNKAVDSILASATRLEKEIERETKYWEQVLAVSDGGWALCRLPNERHTLGVRFGFSEAAPAFKTRSLAALRRNPDGTIFLDQGISRTEPKILRVRIHTSSSETGSSTVPPSIPDDAPIESLILQARNTIFSSELWQELNREARSLASFGVRTKDDAIICPLTRNKAIVIDVVPLGDIYSPTSGADNKIAESLCLALQLLLSCAHRQNHRRRTQPPPAISNQKRLPAPYNLLRPLITRLNHQSAISSIHALFNPLCSVLRATQINPKPSYETVSSPPPSSITNTLSVTESIIQSITDRLESITTFKITESISVIIKSRTTMFPVAGTVHILSLQPDDCPLITACKPPNHLDNWSRVEEYVLYATSCALASSFALPVTVQDETVASATAVAPPKDIWQPTTQANVLRKVGTEDEDGGRVKQISFSVQKIADGVKVRVKWEFMGGGLLHWNDARSGGREKADRNGEGMYEWGANRNISNSMGDWGEGDGEGEVVRSLQDVVQDAGKVWGI